MSFLRAGWLGAPLEIGVRSSVTREEIGVEPLLLHIERSQLRWLGHLFRMPLDASLGRCSRHVPPGGGPGEDPGHAGERLCLSAGLGTPLRVPPEELEEVSGVQYSAYVGIGGLFSVVKLFCGGLLFWFMVKFSLGRKLLTTIEDTCFSLTFFGEGYSEGSDPTQGQPNAKICTQVIGAGCSVAGSVALCPPLIVTVISFFFSL
ncbi:hypothetical protein L3Q82_001251 [Scortum barcoo]|uniref:Uncharacterized protein n=1 Tax=Scortum barcoo TaxID=214431 RepID=A0ACB8W763_9TELE|nr:hypothetical protein L3Q82_001251 [Scortum barcoo]